MVHGRYAPKSRFRSSDDSWQNHDTQKNACGQHDISLAMGNLPEQWNQNHHAEKAVHDRRDSGQQLGGCLQGTVDFLRAVVRHENRGQDSDGNSDENRSRCHIDTAQDKGQDSENVVARLPSGSQQELHRSDFSDGRKSVGK